MRKGKRRDKRVMEGKLENLTFWTQRYEEVKDEEEGRGDLIVIKDSSRS